MFLAMKWIAVALVLLLTEQNAAAWAGLGHRVVAENAALLLRDDSPVWGDFLARHRFEIGTYALYPDDYFRFIDGQKGAREAPTHFFFIDVAGPHPLLDRASEDALLKKSGHSLSEIGTAPWRIDQFFNRAKTKLAAAQPLHNGYQPGRSGDPATRALWESLYELGVLAHYTGDALVPYHATHDKNGWDVGLGGNHWYFESNCLDALEPSLAPAALALAKKNKKAWLAEWKEKDPLPLSFAVYRDTLNAVSEANRIDAQSVTIEKSDAAKQISAKRKTPHDGCPAFRDLLVERLAKASVFTAALWEAALPAEAPPEALTIQFADVWNDPPFPEP